MYSKLMKNTIIEFSNFISIGFALKFGLILAVGNYILCNKCEMSAIRSFESSRALNWTGIE